MLRDLEWPTLEQRRHHSSLTMLYKIYNRLVDTDFTSQFTLMKQSSNRGHASHFLQPQRSSFLPRTVRDWNALAMDPLFFQIASMTPSGTTSLLIRHLTSSFFSLTTFLPAGNVALITQPLCVYLRVRSRTVNGS